MVAARKRRARRGANLLEVMVAVVIAGTVVTAMGAFITGSMKFQRSEDDKQFAQRKAAQILEELVSAQREDSSQENLTRFADGAKYELSLLATHPLDRISDNKSVDGTYKYLRTVEFEPLATDQKAFRATVKVWVNQPHYPANAPAIPPSPPAGVASSVFRLPISTTPSKTKVKIFALNIANIPSLLLKNESASTPEQYHASPKQARDDFEAALTAFRDANPNIELDVTYVTRLGLGRDPEYRPYANSDDPAAGGSSDDMSWAYLYPTHLWSGGPKYHEPRSKLALLRGVGPTPDRDTSDQDRLPVADRFNHVVRAPLEYPNPEDPAASTTPQILPGAEGAPSLAQLLNEMGKGNPEYSNALIVNLHGEAFPALPLRNYSDAAKQSDCNADTFQGRRLVTHPLRLVSHSTEPMALLVHAFKDDGDVMEHDSSPHEMDPDFVEPSSWHPFAPEGAWKDPSRTARAGEVRIRNIKQYLDDLNGDSTVNADDVFISVIQRVYDDSNTSQYNDVVYSAKIEWPTTLPGTLPTHVLSNVAGSNENQISRSREKDSVRRWHSGPHVTAHAWSSGHQGQRHDSFNISHGLDPSFSGDDFVIRLRDLDFDCRPVDDGSSRYGLGGSVRLHGLQYFPDPYLPLLNQPIPSGSNQPRNTARVVIQFKLKASSGGRRFEVDTLLADADNSSISYPSIGSSTHLVSQQQISRTWFYGPGTNLPLTERYQLVGDPRHNPYADVRRSVNAAPGDSGFNPQLANGLNRYWSDFTSGNDTYSDIKNNKDTASANRKAIKPSVVNPLLHSDEAPEQYESNPLFLMTGSDSRLDLQIKKSSDSYEGLKFNVPAYMELWRTALLSSHNVLVNPFGVPMRYLLQGGEFALTGKLDDATIGNVNGDSFNSTSNAGVLADELFGGGSSKSLGWICRPTDNWYAKPWIGEMYPSFKAPSGAYEPYVSMWLPYGNLRTEPSGYSISRFTRRALSTLSNFDSLSDQSNANNGVRLTTSALPLLVGTGSPPKVNVVASGVGAAMTLGGQGKQEFDAFRLGVPSAGLLARGGVELTGGSLTEPVPTAQELVVDWLWTGKPEEGWGKSSLSGQAIGGFSLRGDASTTGGDLDTAASGGTVVFSALGGGAGLSRAAEPVAVGLSLGLASYLEAGTKAQGEGNLDPLPRLRWSKPYHQQKVKLAGGTLPLAWFTTWTRPDGTPYSPVLPVGNFQKPFDQAKGDPGDYRFLIKYREAGWTKYKYANVSGQGGSSSWVDDGDPSTPGGVTPLVDAASVGQASKATWNLSGLSAGKDYFVRLEAYRVDASGKPVGLCSSHEVTISVVP